MGKAKDKYHHGDLRRRLVEAGIDFLATDAEAEPSLRQLAKSIGVSEAAPYHHFADRQAFLNALICAGYDRLRSRCLAAEEAGGGLRGLLAAYVGFAVDHRSLFRLIHRSGAARDPAHAELHAASQAAFAPLLAQVRRQAAAVGIADPERIGFLALMVWTQVHGLAEIVLADFLRLADGRDAFCERAYAYMETGLSAALGQS